MRQKNKAWNWVKRSSTRIWDGFLQNIGVCILAFFVSGGYLVALNKIKLFQKWIREIPTEWVLTPFILSIILSVVLSKINHKQKQQLSKLEKEPPKDERDARFVTHCGVWWKIYLDSEYIEDFPYCTCCEPHIKLAQTEWHPDEIFQCPVSKAIFKLFGDKVPLNRHRVIDGLYRVYFRNLGSNVENNFCAERNRLRELNPKITNEELFDKLFKLSPLNRIPREELDEIKKKYPNPTQAYYFIDRHFSRYKSFFKNSNSS